MHLMKVYTSLVYQHEHVRLLHVTNGKNRTRRKQLLSIQAQKEQSINCTDKCTSRAFNVARAIDFLWAVVRTSSVMRRIHSYIMECRMRSCIYTSFASKLNLDLLETLSIRWFARVTRDCFEDMGELVSLLKTMNELQIAASSWSESNKYFCERWRNNLVVLNCWYRRSLPILLCLQITCNFRRN